MDERTPEPDGPLTASGGTPGASLDGAAAQGRDGAGGANPVGSLDGVSSFMGIRWTDAQTVRLQIRPELINAGGLLSPADRSGSPDDVLNGIAYNAENGTFLVTGKRWPKLFEVRFRPQ